MSAYTGKLRHEGHYILEEDGQAIGVFGGTDPANASHLVTCWNEHDALVKERDELVAALSATQRILGRVPLSKEVGGRWLKNIKILDRYPEAS